MFSTRKKKDIQYQTYLKHREYLVNQKHKLIEGEVKLLLILSTGSYTLFYSSSFVSEYIHFMVYIILAQYFSLASLICIMISYILSAQSFRTEIRREDLIYKNIGNKRKIKFPENKYKVFSGIFFCFARFLVILALFFGFMFIKLNS